MTPGLIKDAVAWFDALFKRKSKLGAIKANPELVWSKIKFFKPHEFDSPDKLSSGFMMDLNLIPITFTNCI